MMKRNYSKREKELIKLSELTGEYHGRFKEDLIILDKLMWLLVYNSGGNYSEELTREREQKTTE